MKLMPVVSAALFALCLCPAAAPAQDLPSYRAPLNGAPGGRDDGASRGGTAALAALAIETISPESHSGLTASASPTLYYFVSQAVTLPVTLTIRAPGQARPIVETSLTAPRAAGIYPVALAGYRVQLQPGVLYTWSVSVTVEAENTNGRAALNALLNQAGLRAAAAYAR